MPNLESDKWCFSLWPLARMAEESEGVKIAHSTSPNLVEIAFGDFLIDSYRYLLIDDDQGQFYIKVQISEERLTDSFGHFIERYLSEPERLYLF